MKHKAQNASKWLKRSLELEAEVGDDTEAYQMTPEELAELMEEELAYSDADASMRSPRPRLTRTRTMKAMSRLRWYGVTRKVASSNLKVYNDLGRYIPQI